MTSPTRQGPDLPEGAGNGLDVELIENRIARWREEAPGDESEWHIELLCDAEEALREMRECLEGLLYWHDHGGRIDESWWDGARAALGRTP